MEGFRKYKLNLSGSVVESPCKDCENRNIKCHIFCNIYNLYLKKLEDYKKMKGVYRQKYEEK